MNETREQTEQAIIGCLLTDPEHVVSTLIDEGVRENWFKEDAFAAIITAAHRLFNENKIGEVDAIGLCDEARKVSRADNWKRSGGFLELQSWTVDVGRTIDAGCVMAHLSWHINNLRQNVIRGNVQKAVQKAMKTFDVDPQGALSILSDAAAKCYTDVVGKTTVSKEEICASLEDAEFQSWHMRVDPDNKERDLNWVPGLKAPWAALTRLYLGIGRRLHIIAARPSVGKTSIAVNLLRFWADQKVKVFVNSLDMPPEDIIDRMRTEYSRVSITKKRYTPTKDNLERLKEASKWVCESSVEVTEQYYVEDYCADLAMKAKGGHCEAAVVDYVQLLNSYAVDNANEYQRVSFVAEYLKRTANHFKIPIIALCQLNRGSTKDEGKEPTLSDLRGSGALEQAASTVLILHREQSVVDDWQKNVPFWFYDNEDYGRKVASQTMDAVWAILAKNQNGPTGRLPFVINKPYFAWKLADYEAKPTEQEEGVGATRRVVKVWRDTFARFHRDWRHDSWEKSLSGKLVGYPIGCQAVEVLLKEEI